MDEIRLSIGNFINTHFSQIKDIRLLIGNSINKLFTNRIYSPTDRQLYYQKFIEIAYPKADFFSPSSPKIFLWVWDGVMGVSSYLPSPMKEFFDDEKMERGWFDSYSDSYVDSSRKPEPRFRGNRVN